jgi:hypothetical protein
MLSEALACAVCAGNPCNNSNVAPANGNSGNCPYQASSTDALGARLLSVDRPPPHYGARAARKWRLMPAAVRLELSAFGVSPTRLCLPLSRVQSSVLNAGRAHALTALFMTTFFVHIAALRAIVAASTRPQTLKALSGATCVLHHRHTSIIDFHKAFFRLF